MTGIITDIIPFSVNDGPGIRTSVYFMGCPLRCRWCHNPETQYGHPHAMVRVDRCTHCGACTVCSSGARGPHGEYDASRCTGCGKCAAVCPEKACWICGREVTPDEILHQVLPDKPFFRRRGGVTLSGGEPMAQPEFALETAKLLCENGIGVCMETCGQADWTSYEQMLPYVQSFLYDYKVSDPESHRQWTGTDNRRILANLRNLSSCGVDIVLRCPLIPGVNDTTDHFLGIAGLTEELQGIRRVEILPYHSLGNNKRVQLGLESESFCVPEKAEVLRWQDELNSMCRVPVCL
ncbi:MAG: glycyl-radical enzyme activating protein [Clostridia bacterium]|nr:glycyl-radical enzyme activating protein [Clostridia bacterium]